MAPKAILETFFLAWLLQIVEDCLSQAVVAVAAVVSAEVAAVVAVEGAVEVVVVVAVEVAALVAAEEAVGVVSLVVLILVVDLVKI